MSDATVESIEPLIGECGWSMGGWNHNGFPGRSVAVIRRLISPEEAKSLMLSTKDDGKITLIDGAKTVFACHLADPDCFNDLKKYLSKYGQG